MGTFVVKAPSPLPSSGVQHVREIKRERERERERGFWEEETVYVS